MRPVAVFLFWVFAFVAFSEAPRDHKVYGPPAPDNGAREPAKRASMAVPFSFGLDETMNSFSTEALQTIVKTTENAFALAQIAPPPGDTLFSWSGDKKPLANKEFRIRITTTSDPVLKKLAAMPGGIPPGLDALTSVGIKPDGTLIIETLLLADRLFSDENGNERPDAMARTVVALGHEIFGNVQNFLKRDINPNQAMTIEMRKADEINAFQAGIDYLNRIIQSSMFQKFPARVQLGLQSALVREQAGLASWKNR